MKFDVKLQIEITGEETEDILEQVLLVICSTLEGKTIASEGLRSFIHVTSGEIKKVQEDALCT